MSSGFGIKQLIINHGDADRFLTKDPEITLFKTIFKRHSNFAMESKETKFQGTIAPSRKAIATLENQGELLHKTWLEITPGTSGVSSTTIAFSAPAWSPSTYYETGSVIKGSTTIIAAPSTAGSTLTSGVAGDYFGENVEINAAGDHMIVAAKWGDAVEGAVYVYKKTAGVWTALGLGSNDGVTANTGGKITTPLPVGSSADSFGSEVAISDAGTTIAVLDKNIGIFVYDYDDVTNYWYARLNNKVNWYVGAGLEPSSFTSLALSADGNIIVVGDDSTQKVFLNKWYPLQKHWHAVGAPINNADPNFGRSVDINNDATILAVGACHSRSNYFQSAQRSNGAVYIYTYSNPTNAIGVGNNGTWSLRDTFIGASVNDEMSFGGVRLSSDGSILSVGSMFDASTNGRLSIYKYNTSVWDLREHKVGNQAAGFSAFFDMSDNGDVLIAGGITGFATPTTQILVYNYLTNQYDSVENHPTVTGGHNGLVAISGDGQEFAIATVNQAEDGLAIARIPGNSGQVSMNTLSTTVSDTTFVVSSAGTSGTAEPSWELNPAEKYTDGTVVFSQTSAAFFPSTAFNIFDYIEDISVWIGTSEVEKHSSDFLKTYYKLNTPAGKKAGFNAMTTKTTATGTSIISPVLRIPLAFWYCNNEPGYSLPLVALKNQEAQIRINFSSALPTGSAATLWTDNIFLDKEEINLFKKLDFEYLICQPHSTTENLTTDSEFPLDVHHSVKEIIWTLDDANHDKVETVTLTMDGIERLSRDGGYFSELQRYNYHTRSRDSSEKNIFVYSFALDPENIHPSGYNNMESYENVKMRIQGSSIGVGAKATIHTLNYNVLKFKDGKAGLLFA
jgi:hypothetical protein